MTKIENARNIINEVDKEMALLFEKRMHAVIDVIEYKIENKLPIFDPLREAEVIKKNLEYIVDEDIKIYYHDYIEMVMEISKNYQKAYLDKEKEN